MTIFIHQILLMIDGTVMLHRWFFKIWSWYSTWIILDTMGTFSEKTAGKFFLLKNFLSLHSLPWLWKCFKENSTDFGKVKLRFSWVWPRERDETKIQKCFFFHLKTCHAPYVSDYLGPDGPSWHSSSTSICHIDLQNCFWNLKSQFFCPLQLLSHFHFSSTFPTSVDFPPTFQIVFHSSDSTLRTMFFVSL